MSTKNFGHLKQHASTNPQAPTHKGLINIDGKSYWISAWWKPHGNGRAGSKLENEPHLSLVADPVEDKPQRHVGGQDFRKTSAPLGDRGIGDAPSGYPDRPNTYMSVPVNQGAHPSTMPRELLDNDIPF